LAESDIQRMQNSVNRPFQLTLATKRAIDIAGSLIALVFFSPLFLPISLLIKLESPGPLFYLPQVVGYRGKRFTLLKFRTMVDGAHQILQNDPKLWDEYRTNLKVKNDSRVTRVGRILRKTSLDELPQLVNILRGELSLVGPRILSKIELARYGDAQGKVLGVVPGLTGLWQVSGRHMVSFERRMELDLFYVDHWNLWMDFMILLKTLPVVLSGKGAG